MPKKYVHFTDEQKEQARQTDSRERDRRIQGEDQGGLRRRSRSHSDNVILSYPPSHIPPRLMAAVIRWGGLQ